MNQQSDAGTPDPKMAIVIAGDVMVDHHLYEGERGAPTMVDKRGVVELPELGGACYLLKLLQATFGQAIHKNQATNAAKQPPAKTLPEERYSIQLGITTPPLQTEPCSHHAYAAWKPFPRWEKSEEHVWRASLLMGYGHERNDNLASGLSPPACTRHVPQRLPNVPPPRILVLDDAGFVFRHQARDDCWLLPSDGPAPEWIVLKMSAPVAQGDLWRRLAADFADRLVCVVSAHELRRECVSLSRGLSWERTIEELRDALQNSPVVQELGKCRHLIVTFSGEGALWLDRSNPKQPAATLICEAGGSEGEWSRSLPGEAFGYLSCMVAAVVRSLAHFSALSVGKRPARPELAAAVASGLTTMRNLRELGHGEVQGDPPTGFPAERLATALLGPNGAFSLISIPWQVDESAQREKQRPWQIVEMTQRPLNSLAQPSLLGLARQVVLQGTGVLKRLPHAQFGDLFTSDRFEIEALRGIRRLMLDYQAQKTAKKPLSLGVFGPPGAGKSFGVREIAKSIFGKEAWLEFNLSQFKDAGDLIGAFHLVRDLVLSGITPVVFWDEFDSQEYLWLQYLLAPMQDGRFQEGQLNHAVGKCVFVFAGGTSFTFEEFGPPAQDHEAMRRYRLRKGPDFQSRLDAYYNVLGPNRRTLPAANADRSAPREPDHDDVCHPLRRAILIRAQLRCGANERLDFDPDVVDALLAVAAYKHGARSLEKVVAAMRPAGGGPIRRSALPPPQQLAMHVDPASFAQALSQNVQFRQAEVIQLLAPAIHETWRGLAAKEGWKMQPHLDRPYDQLSAADQDDNRAAALRIPEILAIAGLRLVKKAGGTTAVDNAAVRAHLEHHLEWLSEAEHDGWMAQRLKNGWRWAEQRDDAMRRHPAIIPYADLPEQEKDKDRSSVRHFPDMIDLAGYQIEFS